MRLIHRPKHARSRSWLSRWITRRKIVAVTAGVVAVGLTAAIAALLLRAPIDGGGSVTAPAGIKFTAASVLAHTGSVNPTAVLNGDNSVTIQLDNALPGDTADVRLVVAKTGTQSGTATVSDFRFSTVTDETITLGQGAVIDGDPGTEVRVRLTVPASASAGAFVAQADAGLYASFA